jgi:uncharacterized damage-inducible protein DinB
MTSIELIRRLHEHRAWVNRNLQTAAERLTTEQLHQPCAIGQGSIWKSLTHLFGAEFVWLEALLGNGSAIAPGDVRGKLPGNQLGPDAFPLLADLLQAWRELDARWQSYLATLTPPDLDNLVEKTSSSTGEMFRTRRSDILLHVCTHAHYTAAQVVNMLRQVGAAPLPATMLIALARE